MKEDFTLFFSWQSMNPKENKYAICKVLKDISVKLKKKGYNLSIDEGTAGSSGSPLISQTILDKIDKCDLFLGDVTNIITENQHQLKGQVSNPNVMFELGYALKVLGWERIILLGNEAFGKVNQLPFDIKGNRILKYNSQHLSFQDTLESRLSGAVQQILKNYEQILSDFNNKSDKKHDSIIYDKIDKLCSQIALMESLSNITDALFAHQNDLDNLRAYYDFYTIHINHFLDTELDNSFKKLIRTLVEMEGLVSTKFFYENIQGGHLYRFPKDPLPHESFIDFDARRYKVQSELIEKKRQVNDAYYDFVMLVKRKNLILNELK